MVSVAGTTASFVVVDFLARVQVEASCRGLELAVYEVAEELRELIELAGLADVLLDEGVGSET